MVLQQVIQEKPNEYFLVKKWSNIMRMYFLWKRWMQIVVLRIIIIYAILEICHTISMLLGVYNIY